MLACGFRAIDRWAPFDHVQVNLQDAALAESEFSHGHQAGFRAFSENGAIRPEEKILYKLLRDRGSATRAFTFQIFARGDLYLLPIEAVMLVETCVLSGNDCVLKIRRDLAERDELVVFVIRRVVSPGLEVALHVYGGGRWVDPFAGHENQRAQEPQTDQKK